MPICEKCDDHSPRLFPIYDDRRIIIQRVCFNCFKKHHKDKVKEDDEYL